MKKLAQDADLFHSAFVSQDHKKIKSAIHTLIVEINHTDHISRSLLGSADREHLMRVLNLIKSNLRKLGPQMKNRAHESEPAIGADPDSTLNDLMSNEIEIFKELAQMARVYDVSSHYLLFFCGADRGFWLQKGIHPLDPIHPNRFKHCGVRVP